MLRIKGILIVMLIVSMLGLGICSLVEHQYKTFALGVLYSVAKYFSFGRAVGADHFDKSYRNKPLVRKGIFRWTRNGMYNFGIPVVWLPGLLLASKAAVLAALFSHLYIWVHYYSVELADMKRIYRD